MTNYGEDGRTNPNHAAMHVHDERERTLAHGQVGPGEQGPAGVPEVFDAVCCADPPC